MHNNREFNIKLERIRQMLQSANLDACHIKRQDNFAWLTCGGVNYVGIGEIGNCSLLITADRIFAITNNIESPRMIKEEYLEVLGFEMRIGVWYNESFEDDTIKDICASGAVGYDYPTAAGRNIMGLIQPLRFSLTAEEVERYKTGGRIVSLAVEEIAATIRPGDTENETAGRLAHLIRRNGLEFHSIFCASDERICQYRHSILTGKVIRERVQFGGNMRYKGLIICCTRYINFIPVTDELREQYKKNVEIDCIMIHNTVVGNSYQIPFLAGKKAYEDRGYGEEFKKHHQGGPIGYTPRDYRINFTHKGIIAENQAFCWNPSITGTKSEDTFIATKDGPIFITQPVIFPTIKVEIDGIEYERAYILEKY